MEHSVSVLLVHLGVDVETWVTKLSDLLGKQLHSLSRVAEDDGLVDLQLENNIHGRMKEDLDFALVQLILFKT